MKLSWKLRFAFLLSLGILFLGGLIFSGCTTIILPPPLSATSLKARVALLDHGHHTSLIVESGPNAMIRYAYGDWKYYALRKTGPLEAFAALFWPTQAGLGRKKLTGAFTAKSFHQKLSVSWEEVIFLEVEREKLSTLLEQLDGIYQQNQSRPIYNDVYDLEFVHHPHSYWIFHNSNQVVGTWLQELGCQLLGLKLFAQWKKQETNLE